jgi:molybdopterin-guanine dinucleotide biosynthesis protein
MTTKSDSITEAVDKLLKVTEGFTPEEIAKIVASRQADKRKEKEKQEKKEKEIAAARANVQTAVQRYADMADIELDVDWAFVWDYLGNKQSITFKSNEVDRDFWNWLWN